MSVSVKSSRRSLDTFRSRARYADDPDRREINTRDACPSVDGQPDLTRVLRTKAMNAKRRQEAKHSFRHALRDLCERVMLRRLGRCQRVKAAADSGQFPLA